MGELVMPNDVLENTFWDAAAEGRYLLEWCITCDKPVYYPRHACPSCLGADLEWRETTGTGTVYAFTVVRAPGSHAVDELIPFVCALVDLTEGARVMTHIVDCDPSDVKICMSVELTWFEHDGRNLPVFRPV